MEIQCFPPSPPAAPTPRAPLQPCSRLAGVFLYKRPILWDARKAMEAFEGHHTKAQRQKAGFDTRIGSPTSSSDFIIKPVVELDFLCRHIQRLKRRSLVPRGEIHTLVYTMNPRSRRLQCVCTRLPFLHRSHVIFMCTRALIHAFFLFFFEVEAFSACKRARWHTCPQYSPGTPVIQAAS